ncbi:hypothetical protein BSKO_01080 [Bryopsis sp. KO-2023]|nr:hypothetical protein BSKO_01080 [Bryopsis sp. KO-2023]
MRVVLVLVAHSGRTLQLGSVQPTTRVGAVQEVLEELTGITVSEQIAMCRGTRLEPSHCLSVYELPTEDGTSAEDSPVFLYSKAYIRPGACLPAEEVLPKFVPKPYPLGELNAEHPLQRAASPLVRALPDYELRFQHQQVTAQEFWDVSQKYFQHCQQLLSEQEVQSRTIDAARANIQLHFNSISRAFTEFLNGFHQQQGLHGEVLREFERDMDVLMGTELCPGLRTEKWEKLVDLLPEGKLRQWAESCRKAHRHFAEKVADLEGLFSVLKSDVEALFMQAPSVDLDDLGLLLADKEHLLEEHGSIIQVLSKDLATVRKLVEDTVKLLGSERLSSGAVHDACGAMESMDESHTGQFIPRMKECTAMLEEFCSHCLECKNRMTRDVLGQLQLISTQQSKIRDMKNKLAAFKEVAGKQDEAFAELMLVRRIPAAYKAALSECIRRKAWMEMYSGQAVRLAEHMGKVRTREVAKRETIQKEISCFLPTEMYSRMGLMEQPPHCQITVPAGEDKLLPVTIHDVRRITSISGSNLSKGKLEAHGSDASQTGAPPSPSTESSEIEGGPMYHPTNKQGQDLELENAKLRADLASQIAARHVQYLERPYFMEVGVTGKSGQQAQEPQQQDQGEVGDSAKQEVVNKFSEALKAQERLNGQLESRLADETRQKQTYESRIFELEDKLEELTKRVESQAGGGNEVVVNLNITVSDGDPGRCLAASEASGVEYRPKSKGELELLGALPDDPS